MKASNLCLLFLVCGAAACGGDDDVDTLPKRGDQPTDPTILDVMIYADTDERAVAISASDPGGSSNLAGCQVIANGEERVGTFNSARCIVTRPLTDGWQIGKSYVIEVLVSNGTGGFTTATVNVEVVSLGI